jgi:hypothetical protein
LLEVNYATMQVNISTNATWQNSSINFDQNITAPPPPSVGDTIVTFLTASICTFGVIGNFIVVLTLFTDRALHSPTFASIACLGVSDFLFLCAQLISESWTILGVQPELMSLVIIDGIAGCTWAISSAHVTVMAAVRYSLLVHPFGSLAWVTVRNVVFTSMSV